MSTCFFLWLTVYIHVHSVVRSWVEQRAHCEPQLMLVEKSVNPLSLPACPPPPTTNKNNSHSIKKLTTKLRMPDKSYGISSELVSDQLHPAQSQCHEQCHRSATGHSLQLVSAHGTDCHHRFVAFILLLFLNDNWRHFYSIVLLTDTTLLGALFVLWHLRRPNHDVLA